MCVLADMKTIDFDCENSYHHEVSVVVPVAHPGGSWYNLLISNYS